MYPSKLMSLCTAFHKIEGIDILRQYRQGYWTAHSHTQRRTYALASVAQPVQTDPIRNDATPSLVVQSWWCLEEQIRAHGEI